MRYFALLLFVTLAAAKAGPNTATRIAVADEPFTLTLDTLGYCPPSFALNLTRDMPTPGWTMTATVKRIEADKTLRVEITAAPPRGRVPMVVTKGTVRVKTGSLLKGAWLVDVHYKAGGEKSKRVQAFTLRAS